MDKFNIYYRYNKDIKMGSISLNDKALEIIKIANSFSELDSFAIFANGEIYPMGTFKPNGRKLCET